jgi:riboflavin synthase
LQLLHLFTGLITDVGRIDRVSETEAGRELRVSCRFSDLRPGESVALNGACLTVRECGPSWFTVAAVSTTLERTSLGKWQAGRRINLERALRANDRLGGHFVLGHVDAVGEVTSVRQQGDATLVDVLIPDALSSLVIPHGSIAVDGVSLTINAIPDENHVQVSLIEYTLRHTTLGDLTAGQDVNVEADVLGKYARRSWESATLNAPR